MKERIEWIDLAKGYGIILVVMGHCFVKDSVIHNLIFSFHMPMFFILSGYCFKPEKYLSCKDVIYIKAKTLLIPYLALWGIGMVFTLLIPEWRNRITLSGMGKDIYQGYPSLSNNTSIWFLLCLFMITVIYYIIYQICKKMNKPKLQVIIIIFSGLGGYSLSLVKNILDSMSTNSVRGGISIPGGRLPLTLDAAMTALVFFYIGIRLREYLYNKKVNNKDLLVYGILFFFINTIFGVFLNSRVNIHGCKFGNPIYFYIAALSGTISVISFCCWIERKKNFNLLRKILVFYGQNSLVMFGMQSLLLHLYIFVINRITGEAYILYEKLPIPYVLIGFVLITFIELPIILYIYSKIKDLLKIRKKAVLSHRGNK